jgi:hypothetical protein
VDGLGGCDLGLVRAHVRNEGGARRVDVGLETFVGVVREEVPVATGVDARHQPVGHAKLALDLYAHVHLLVVVIGGPLLHGITQGVLVLPLDPFTQLSWLLSCHDRPPRTHSESLLWVGV